MCVKTLEELLDPPQLLEVKEILRTTQDYGQVMLKLLDYLKQYDDNLKSKGIYYRWLAYWITANWMKIKEGET